MSFGRAVGRGPRAEHALQEPLPRAPRVVRTQKFDSPLVARPSVVSSRHWRRLRKTWERIGIVLFFSTMPCERQRIGPGSQPRPGVSAGSVPSPAEAHGACRVRSRASRSRARATFRTRARASAPDQSGNRRRGLSTTREVRRHCDSGWFMPPVAGRERFTREPALASLRRK